MSQVETIRTLIEYHLATTRRVWDSVDQIGDEQFLAEDGYSRGSIRNLMVHITSTDRRWLAGLKDLPDVSHLNPEDYPTRAAARALFEEVAADLNAFASALTVADLEANAANIPNPRWQVLHHMVNHGTDHRATVLQKLHEYGAPTFGQDFILWLWDRSK